MAASHTGACQFQGRRHLECHAECPQRDDGHCLGLLVLFFAAGIVKTCGSFAEARRPEHALKLFVRFILAKAAVQYGLELMLAVFDIVQGIVSRAMSASGPEGRPPLRCRRKSWTRSARLVFGAASSCGR